ncbi:YbjN domain-containing protein [Microcoleus sp. FACHB-672]|uniref:YbjN domain-containing protein n=1 Tax=Microcoleus sp. FACHB-672 TaxID=2692825 RepID=UPI0016853BA2|nr:YbjN domain-containing protein [Microcoleus sp. FACHB-672]MBD2042192.1 YbjN domain-containing protein [Microcoleus sp. FACHB-672]
MTTSEQNLQAVSAQSPSTEDIITNKLVEDATTINLIGEIETVVTSMAIDQKVMVAQGEEGHLWKFNYGSVEVFVQLTGTTDDDTLSVWSFVMQLPAKNEPQLMRKLLEMNASATFESRFGIVNDQVVVIATRTVADLSPTEISRTITIVATIADDNDDALQAEYGQ